MLQDQKKQEEHDDFRSIPSSDSETDKTNTNKRRPSINNQAIRLPRSPFANIHQGRSNKETYLPYLP
jgi:hypothetical protein